MLVNGAFRSAWLVACVILTGTTVVLAQGGLGTFNGRVVDPENAVLPGVTITATNTRTNVARTTVTNTEGLYNLPALEPGEYTIQADLPGFAALTRTGVTLAVNQTLTVDMTLGLAAVQETVTVSGAIPLIETTQSLVSATVRTREVVNLPLITRNMNGLLSLIPGSKPITPVHIYKRNWGSVSFGGSTGRNMVPVVDGGDNRDNINGGYLLNYTVEGVEEFQVASHQFSAADGRSSGAAVNVVTKSGTNTLRGSGFVMGRDRSMTAKDFFTARDNLPKLPFSRQQFGGHVGGPIIAGRAFFFGALEGIRENTSFTISDRVYNELKLIPAFTGVQVPPEQRLDKPYRETLYTLKGNAQLGQNHSLIARFYSQKTNAVDSQKGVTPYFLFETRPRIDEDNDGWDIVGQHGWTLGNRALNQFTLHYSRFISQTDYDNYHRNYPNVPRPPDVGNLLFPFGNTGFAALTPYNVFQNMWQLKNIYTLQSGSHGLKIGGEYSWHPRFGGECCLRFGQFTFFDDPSVIVSNSNGRYPQGFQTPGIARQWMGGANIKTNNYAISGVSQVKAFFQDDWRVRRRLTLNLGVRYDVDRNFYDQDGGYSNNLTYAVLKAIDSPYAAPPKTPMTDISPRLGFAYDLGGDGRRVLRGGYGLYFDGTGGTNNITVFIQNKRPITFDKVLVNSAIGVGQLADYRFGVDPPPPAPPAVTDAAGAFPPGASSTTGWFDPDVSDPRSHHVHIGYSHELSANTVLSADYTHVTNLNDFKAVPINTFTGGVRRLAPDLARVYGDPNLLGNVTLVSSINRGRYDELAVQFQRRLPRATLQVNYILSGAYAYAGTIAGSVTAVPAAQDAENPFGPGEWGPTASDERHRVVVYGVIDLPGGLQVSPVLQAATPRPYNLLAGADLNADGMFNDRYVDPATGRQASVNSQRGDSFVLVDARVTKFFTLGRESRTLGVFAEFFNLFNTANFGDSYNGNGRSVLFRQPIALLPGAGYPFQVQLGARYTF